VSALCPRTSSVTRRVTADTGQTWAASPAKPSMFDASEDEDEAESMEVDEPLLVVSPSKAQATVLGCETCGKVGDIGSSSGLLGGSLTHWCPGWKKGPLGKRLLCDDCGEVRLRMLSV
jgi:hypothetical protein